ELLRRGNEMPFEQLIMPMMAVMMLCLAVATTTFAGPNPPTKSQRAGDRNPVAAPPHESVMIDGKLDSLDLEEKKLVVTVKEQQKVYVATAACTVSKDGKTVELGSL